jgi:hypothetical protein
MKKVIHRLQDCIIIVAILFFSAFVSYRATNMVFGQLDPGAQQTLNGSVTTTDRGSL